MSCASVRPLVRATAIDSCEKVRTRKFKHEHVDHMVAVPDLGIASLDASDNEGDAEQHLHAGKRAVALTVDA